MGALPLSVGMLVGGDGDSLDGLLEFAMVLSLGEVAAGAAPRIDGPDLLVLAGFLGGFFSVVAAVACGPDSFGALRSTAAASAVAILAFSLALTETSAGDGAADSVVLKVDDATRGVLLELDVTWLSTSAPPMTTAVIVPKAMEK